MCAQVASIPPVGAPETADGAGADTAFLVLAGSEVGEGRGLAEASEEPIENDAPSPPAYESRRKRHSTAAATKASVAAANDNGEPAPPEELEVDAERQFLSRWASLDLQDEALAELGKLAGDLAAAERAMLALQAERGLPRTAAAEAARTVALSQAIISSRKDMRKAQARARPASLVSVRGAA